MHRFWQGWFARKTKSSSQSSSRKRLRIEDLETRNLCAGVHQDGDVLVIDATNSGDTVVVEMNDGGTKYGNPYDDKIIVKWTHNGVTETKTYNLYKYVFAGDGIKAVQNIDWIQFNGGSGNDKFWNNTGLVSYDYGNAGNDELHGGSDFDHIEGGKGSDTIFGNGGNDYLYANKPNAVGTESAVDVIHGGDDVDFIWGMDGGSNYLYGDDGNDWLYGGDVGGLNFIDGGYGDDHLVGGDGKPGTMSVFNQLTDHHGADWVYGGNNSMNFIDTVDGWQGKAADDIILVGVGGYTKWWSDPYQLVNGQWVGDSVPEYT